jgi:hypothetical protein
MAGQSCCLGVEPPRVVLPVVQEQMYRQQLPLLYLQVYLHRPLLGPQLLRWCHQPACTVRLLRRRQHWLLLGCGVAGGLC